VGPERRGAPIERGALPERERCRPPQLPRPGPASPGLLAIGVPRPVDIATYGDLALPRELPDADKVVFGQVTAGNGLRVMAYDVPGQREPASLATTAARSTRRENGMTLTSEPFFLSVGGDTVKEVEACGTSCPPVARSSRHFGPAQWAPAFGTLTDRFGVTWILDVA
jgi:PhnB protein